MDWMEERFDEMHDRFVAGAKVPYQPQGSNINDLNYFNSRPEGNKSNLQFFIHL